MAKGNMLLGMARKKIGDVVFYRANGEQISRARNRAPKNPRSEKQSVQRMVLATASKTLAALAGLYDHSFEGVQVGIKSRQHAQRLLMEGYRGYAAAIINTGVVEDDRVIFAIKGAPIAAIYQGMPLSRGRLSMNTYSVQDDNSDPDATSGRLTLASALSADAITTQSAYAAELAKLGLEPGDQLTVVGYFQNGSNIVASFESPYGIADNEADMYRYARITFASELPEGFSGTLIEDRAFNSALIISAEGIMPPVSEITGDSPAIDFDFAEVAPLGFALRGLAVVRSQLSAGGKTYYSPANFEVSKRVVSGNVLRIMSSYMDGATGINIGDTLYLKHAVASPITGNEPTPEVSPYEVSPALPFTTAQNDTFLITKRDGTNFTTEEVEGLVFTINGSVVSSSPSGQIDWNVDAATVLEVSRTTWSSSVEVTMLAAGYTVSAVE